MYGEKDSQWIPEEVESSDFEDDDEGESLERNVDEDDLTDFVGPHDVEDSDGLEEDYDDVE